ncbi:CocE/NonD family hydrolase [Micromonospora sp. FIMYZ51]|uniref:CocE/NonD family hydrolase n=1 Tax=Micromonospora sp. FIMYZ51 TaxID=3051832 RepID=UPI00311E646E
MTTSSADPRRRRLCTGRLGARDNSITLDADVRVHRRDGTALSADVYRPSGPGRHPVLVMRTPYDKRVAQSYWYAPPTWYAAQGFAVVVEDVRGRHRSDGEFVPLDNERDDGVDLVRWVVDQPWSDGWVGMYGYSYGGLLQLLTAGADGEVPIAAVVPALAPPGLGEGCLRTGGVAAASFTTTWAVQLDALRISRALREPSADRLTAQSLRWLVQNVPLDRLLDGATSASAAGWLREWLTVGSDSEYWRRPSHRVAYGNIKAPVLHVGGLYDTFRTGTFGHYTSLAEARPDHSANRLFVGPWTHHPLRASAPGLSAGTPPSIDDVQLEFFRTVREGGVPARPAVSVTILNSGDTWTAQSWPPADGVRHRWHLSSGGRANTATGDGILTEDPPPPAPPDHLVYDHGDPVPAAGGDDCGDPLLAGMGAADQCAPERRNDVLVYTSRPAAAERTFVGEANVEFFAVTDTRHSQWLVRLCLVNQAGRSVNLVEQVTRHRGERPGEPTRVAIALGPAGFRIHPGERLRLHVTQGASPRWSPLRDRDGRPAVTRSLVLHDPDHPSALELTRVP